MAHRGREELSWRRMAGGPQETTASGAAAGLDAAGTEWGVEGVGEV